MTQYMQKALLRESLLCYHGEKHFAFNFHGGWLV